MSAFNNSAVIESIQGAFQVFRFLIAFLTSVYDGSLVFMSIIVGSVTSLSVISLMALLYLKYFLKVFIPSSPLSH